MIGMSASKIGMAAAGVGAFGTAAALVHAQSKSIDRNWAPVEKANPDAAPALRSQAHSAKVIAALGVDMGVLAAGVEGVFLTRQIGALRHMSPDALIAAQTTAKRIAFVGSLGGMAGSAIGSGVLG